ncbi:hypothetical protein MKX01_006464, partial [Papaver californicum]
MKQLKKLEKLCPLATIYCAGSGRKGSSILVGFGFLLGASILFVTIISFMFPSFMNPMLQNNLNRFYQKIPFSHISFDSSNTPSTTTSVTSDNFSSNPSQELKENSTTQNQTIIVSSSAELTKDFTQTNQTKSANYSSVISGGPPEVEELGIPTSNFSSNSSRLYDAKLENGDANSSSHGQHYCNIFEGEWVWPVNDSRKPFYPPGTCPYIGREPFDCYNNGRPDDAFLKLQWQWQSHPTNAGCNNNFP